MGRELTALSVFFLITCFVWGQNKQQVSIGILADKSGPSYEASLNALQSEIRAVVGETADISFLPVLQNDFDPEKAAANYQQLVLEGVDIILSFGFVNNFSLYQSGVYPVPTLALGAANADLVQLPEGQETTGIPNLNYVITPISYRQDLDTFYELYDYQNIGIAVDEVLVNTLPLKDYFDGYFGDKESNYRLIGLRPGMDYGNELKGLDAIYIAGAGFYTDSEFGMLVEAINELRLPSFSINGVRDLERGMLITNQPLDFINNFIRRISLNVESVLKGTNPSELPLRISYEKQLSMNYATAVNIGFPIRYSAIGQLDFVGTSQELYAEKTYGLLDLMKGVIDSNLQLMAERKEVDLAEQDVKTSKSAYYPNLGATLDATYTDPKQAERSFGNNPELSTNAGAQLGQTLYSEAAGANITISQKQQQARQAAYNASELDAILEASVSYFNALIFKTNVRIQNENLKTTRRNLEIAELNFEVGESSKYDELRFTSELAANIQSFIDAQRDYQQSLYAINRLLNNPIDMDIDIEQADIGTGIFTGYSYERLKDLMDNPTLRPALVDFMIEVAMENSPELKNIGFNQEANERFYNLNNLGRLVPTVSLQGRYSLVLDRSGAGSTAPEGFLPLIDDFYTVGLNLSLPVFQQSQRNINKQSALIQKDQLEILQQDTERAIEQNINDIVVEILNRISNIEISKVAEKAAREALELTQASYAEGEALLIELVDAQNTYLNAQLASATANYSYLLAAIQLERAIGYYFLLNTDDANVVFMQRAQQFMLERN